MIGVTVSGNAADRYRRNPSDDIEDLAAATVQAWVGASGSVINTARGPGPDFRIDYHDGRRGFGEVGWHVDPRVQEMWAHTFKRPKHQQIELEPGSGQWAMKLRVGARIDRLYSGGLQQLIDEMIAAEVPRLTVWPSWPHTEVAEIARKLGIEYLWRSSDDEPAVGIYFLPGPPGAFIPEDPDVIVDWVEGVLADPNYLDTTAKLLAVTCDERHVFLMTGSRTDAGTEERLRRIETGLPRRDPQVAEGITHLWLAPQFGPPVAALWSSSAGWTYATLVQADVLDEDS